MSWKNNGYLAIALLVLLVPLALLPVEGDLMVLLGSAFIVMVAALLISLCIAVGAALRRYVRANRKSSRRSSVQR